MGKTGVSSQDFEYTLYNFENLNFYYGSSKYFIDILTNLEYI